jgi:tight adherence protein B
MGQVMPSIDPRRLVRRVRWMLAVSLAALLALVAAAVPAAAAESKSVQIVGQEGRTVDFLVYLDPTVSVSEGADVSSTVVVSGVEVPSEATAIVEDTAPQEAILVLDVSGSMRGPRLASAKDAATAYVNTLPDDVEIGLVSFNDTVEIVVEPTTDKAEVNRAIDGLEAGRKTALFDGIIAGLDLANADLGARLLVLSDGGDTVSAATVDDVKASAALEGIPIDIVALTPTTAHAEVLRSISVPTGGQFLLATDVTGLGQAFDEATGSFGGKVAVTAEFPEDVDASGKFAIVTVGVGDVDYTGTAQLPTSEQLAAAGGAGGAGTTVTTPTTPTVPGDEVVVEQASNPFTTWLLAILAALIIIVAALAYASYRRQLKSRMRTDQVLWYSSAVTTGAALGRRPDVGGGGVLDGLDEWLATQSWYPNVDTKLDNAGMTMNVATWVMVRVVVTLALALLVAILLGNVLVGILIGGLIGWLVSGAWLTSRQDARRKAFEEELPDFLLLIASSLRSGLSFQQGLDSMAAEGQGEVSRQMRRALSEVQMGATIEQALMRVSDRMRSEDLKWTVTALAIQREVGGNLSNILETAAQTIKSRAELRREVRTLSAEGRLSGWVLAALPVGLFVYMLFANRPYVSFFWSYTIGYIMLGLLVVLFIIGFIWIRKIAKIEV